MTHRRKPCARPSRVRWPDQGDPARAWAEGLWSEARKVLALTTRRSVMESWIDKMETTAAPYGTLQLACPDAHFGEYLQSSGLWRQICNTCHEVARERFNETIDMALAFE